MAAPLRIVTRIVSLLKSAAVADWASTGAMPFIG